MPLTEVAALLELLQWESNSVSNVKSIYAAISKELLLFDQSPIILFVAVKGTSSLK